MPMLTLNRLGMCYIVCPSLMSAPQGLYFYVIQVKTSIIKNANNKGPEQTAQMCSLLRVLVVCDKEY